MLGFSIMFNDDANVDLENPQIMHYIFCHNNPINATIQEHNSKEG
jgi:hypothetical protein